MRFDEKLGVYTNMETGTMEFVLWSRKKLRGLLLLKECNEAKFVLLENQLHARFQPFFHSECGIYLHLLR